MRPRLQRILSLFLSLLLTITLIPSDVLAVGIAPGASLVSPIPSPIKGDTPFSVNNRGFAGFALGLQFMGSDYTVKYSEKKDAAADAMTEGLARTAMHFVTNYPDPYNSDSADSSYAFYVLPEIPTHEGRTYYEFTYNSTQYGKREMSRYTVVSDAPEPSTNTYGKKIWDAAKANADDAKPNPNLTESEALTLLRSISYGDAKSILAGLYSPRQPSTYWNQPNVTEINQRVEDFLIDGIDGNSDQVVRAYRQMCNYTALLGCVARAAYNGDAYNEATKRIATFLSDALDGQPYTPIVVIAETVRVFEDGLGRDDDECDTWRTARDSLAAVAGYGDPDVLSKIGTATLNSNHIVDCILRADWPAFTSESGLNNPAVGIFWKVMQNRNFNKSIGGHGCVGLWWNGKGVGNYAGGTPVSRCITAVSADVVQLAAQTLGISVASGLEGPWGVGVYGLTSAFSVPGEPSTEQHADGYLAGEVGIFPNTTKIVENNSYSEVEDVIVKLKLKDVQVRWDKTTTDASGNVTHEGEQYNDLPTVLGWLRDQGASSPVIKIYTKQAQPIPTAGDDYFNRLVTTYRKHVSGDEHGLEQGKLSWSAVQGNFVLTNEPDGFSVSCSGDTLTLTITDYMAAIKYFEQDDSDLIFLASNVPLTGTLQDPTCINDHYFKVGATVTISGPPSMDNLGQAQTLSKSGLSTYDKYCRIQVAKMPDGDIQFYSIEEGNYSEFKQGELRTNAITSDEKFNAMAGTPTVTDGRYYQYFAVGGNEYALEFTGTAYTNQNDARQYSGIYTQVQCDYPGPIPCPGVCPYGHFVQTGVDANGSPIGYVYHCGSHCACGVHHSCEWPHMVGDSWVWEQDLLNFSYIKIDYLKVWKLVRGKVDGTVELIDTDEVTASILDQTADMPFWNVAGSNTSAAGRFVHTYMPTAHDHYNFITKPSDNSCTEHTKKNRDDLKGRTAGAVNTTTCISDFVVLRTTAGDQSILYYEYNATNTAIIDLQGDTPVAEEIIFEYRSKEDMWDNNPHTAVNMPADGITWGGYSGNYMNTGNKYQSTGYTGNFINLESTTAWKDPSRRYTSLKAACKDPTSTLRLMAGGLVIPDEKCNGEYIIGDAEVFYQELVSSGSGVTLHASSSQADYGGKGYVKAAPYSPNHSKINDVVVFDPVSTQYAEVISVSPARDQRTASTTEKSGVFVQLDWGFRMNFPNTGDFAGHGQRATSETGFSPGLGYSNGMDVTEWTQSKWVRFPFTVTWNNVTYPEGVTIDLPVTQTTFDFYVPLADREVKMGQVEWGAIAINSQTGNDLDCHPNQDHNMNEIIYKGHKYGRWHTAHKIQLVDVVGRIGQLTIEDSGDYRFSNIFKKTTDDWYIKGVIHKVDLSQPNLIVTDPIDIRGQAISADEYADTYGVRPERRQSGLRFPLVPAQNPVDLLKKQPMRLGYKLYMDVTTNGDYYGENSTNAFNKVQVTPMYWYVDLSSGKWTPVDVYVTAGTTYKLANRFRDFSENAPNVWSVSINWDEEAVRRNYNGLEVELSEAVKDVYGCALPHGTEFAYGNAQRLYLKDRNRTFIGTEYSNGEFHNPGNALDPIMFSRQAQRWHFSLGLPSSAVFVKTGETCNKTNINKLINNHSVIVCALDIKARGDVWTLEYDGTAINQPFQVVGGTATIDPVNGSGREDAGTVLPGTDPVVAVFSVNKSSQDDLKVTGTH